MNPMKNYRITVNGVSYDVTVEETAAVANQPAAAHPVGQSYDRRQCGTGRRSRRRGGAEFRVSHEAAHDSYNVKH